MGILIFFRFVVGTLGFFSVDERVCFLRFRVGERVLIVICVYVSSGSLEYLVFLEFLGGVLEGVLFGDFVVLLGDFNVYVGNDSEIWRGVIGRNGFFDLNSSGVLLLDFCVNYSLVITNILFEYKSVYKCTWY